jgi:hypothetical protein
MSKSCIGGGEARMWLLMNLLVEYLSHNHVDLSSGIVVW